MLELKSTKRVQIAPSKKLKSELKVNFTEFSEFMQYLNNNGINFKLSENEKVHFNRIFSPAEISELREESCLITTDTLPVKNEYLILYEETVKQKIKELKAEIEVLSNKRKEYAQFAKEGKMCDNLEVSEKIEIKTDKEKLTFAKIDGEIQLVEFIEGFNFDLFDTDFDLLKNLILNEIKNENNEKSEVSE